MLRYTLGLWLITMFAGALQVQAQSGNITEAKSLFNRYEYSQSLSIYLQMANKNKPKAYAIEGVANCYRVLGDDTQAEIWYAKLDGMAGAKPIDTYYYAETLLRNGKLDKAREKYKAYFGANSNQQQLNFKLATCDSAAAWMKGPTNFKITAQTSMNTPNADWGVNYAGRTALVYTSDRKVEDYSMKKPKDKYKGERVKMFNYDLINEFTDLMQFDKSEKLDLNMDYHTGPMVLTASGDTAYLTIADREEKEDIFIDFKKGNERTYIRPFELLQLIKKGDQWSKITPFPYNNIKKYSIGYAALSRDAQIIYFTSNMPGGQGGTDIWYCEKMSNGSWGKPVNCGSVINTPGDEAFPSIGGDGKLYYSSNGLPGMGGFDVFAAKGTRADWSRPVNLKYPINSSSDDFGLITRDGKSGYLSSNRAGGKGSDDIYSFGIDDKKPSPNKSNELTDVKPSVVVPSTPAVATPQKTIVPPVISPRPATTVPPPATPQKTDSAPITSPIVATPVPPTVAAPANSLILQGLVSDSKTGQAIDSVTVLLKNTHGDVIGGNMVPANQNFAFKANRGRNYILEARKKGYYPITQNIATDNATAVGLTSLSLKMEPLEIGKTFVLRNIYYDLNRATIRKDAMVELDKLVTLMKENPSLRIELSSHTDSRGSDYYNMLMSQARAVSAVAYLKRRGIAADRMVAKGYGETHLLNGCANGVPCTEEQHQENRRTEIKVIGGNFK